MAVPTHKTGLNKTLGQKSSAIYSTNLTGNFDPTAGIASTHWTNQAASNALRRYNGITFNNSTPKNFEFDGTNDFLGEASSGYGGTAFTIITSSAFTVAQWYKHKTGSRHMAFGIVYSGSDIVFLSTGHRVANKMSVENDGGTRIDFDYTFSNNTWYYVALVYHGSNNFSFFVNGSFVGSGSLTIGGVSGAIVQIGKIAGSTFTQAGIKVGNVHSYSSALGGSALRQNFLATQSINNLRRYGNNYTA